MTEDRFLSELRGELVAATERRETVELLRRRHPGRFLAAAAVVVLVAVGVVFVASPRPAAAGVEVIRVGDELIIRLTDVETRPDEIEAAAAEAGLSIEVEEVPVGPSMVGRFVSAFAGEMPDVIRTVGDDGGLSFDGVRVPVGFAETLTFYLGRASRPGETWAAGSDSTAKGEPMACADVVGRPVADVLAEVRGKGVDSVRVFVLDGGGEVPVDQLGQFAQATVRRLISPDPDSVWLEAAEDPEQIREPSTRAGCK